ncbi:glycoside hydrolase domain-containing protein [Clavibacter sp. VKM Ac-2872]|uniref:glycoside hydrolase domain-containing protein n=1 Tax=Clavibacter sp. VKM Ac-2872 TaxID=2783812 RepID=UPI00188C32C5|nr:glycoside hydrolase domain-containing protein [Clavibacter sp. VKM Ac-2872]MBF4622746.1 DUF1906 domain-containing protein [Clavibacter sp. VKM Ac-2872]
MDNNWVLNSQRWLNAQYTGVAGYSPIEEDGSAGWQTMYALTRALQHELGIASLSDNFGSATSASFVTKLGSVSILTTIPNVIGIVQCAIWCKGVFGDTQFGRWSDAVSLAVVKLRDGLGLPSTASVDVKLMRWLLTMDTNALTAGGSGAVRAGQQWLNSRYSNRSGFSLLACDGHYTRDVQRGLLLAIQYEIPMDDATANGNFGPGTQSGLRTQASSAFGDKDGAKSFISLFQLALAFNGYDITRNGTFDSATRSATTAFQQFLEITVTGAADFGTWAALLVSTGDVSRPVSMVDSTTEFTVERAVSIRAQGYHTAGRYLTVAGKSIGRGEISLLFDAGFTIVPLFQEYNNGPQYFTSAIGQDQGTRAALRARQLGFKSGTVIFFAVDYDAFASEIDTLLKPYFEGVNRGVDTSATVEYKVGIYSTRNACSRISEMGLAEAVWVSGMSSGYSGNLGFPMPKGWWYNQILEVKASNIDRNAVSVRARPTTRDMVIRTPDATVRSRSLHWSIVNQEVLAERAMAAHMTATPRGASTLVLFYLMRTKYAYGPFLKYTPYSEFLAYSSPTMQALYTAARTDYFAASGLPATIVSDYDGDLEHLAVVAQGVNYWGACAGDGAIGIGDLGGWALDVVQLWANFRKFAGGLSIDDFVSANLGGSDGETSEWQLPDLISDADGWLVGRDVLGGISMSESMAHWFGSRPESVDRIADFLRARFARAGVGLADAIGQNIESIFAGGWPWPSYARSAFGEGQADPTKDELTLFVNACTTTLLSRAGLPATS